MTKAAPAIRIHRKSPWGKKVSRYTNGTESIAPRIPETIDEATIRKELCTIDTVYHMIGRMSTT